MTTFKNFVLAIAVLLAVAACGRSASPKTAADASTDGPAPISPSTSAGGTQGTPPYNEPLPGGSATTDTTTTSGGGDLAGGLAHVRVLGVANPGFTSVLVAVKSLEVTVDGAPVLVDFSRVQTTFELTNSSQAWLAGRVAMPPGGSTVHVKLVLDDAAAFSTADSAGDLRTCGPAIEFDAPAEWFALRGHAVVHLDLARSIVGTGGTRDLIPQLQVEF